MAEPSSASSFPQNHPEPEIRFEGQPSHTRDHRPFTNDASASTSTAALPNNDYVYDVFINHRGPDTKKIFVSHLYRRLLSHGLRSFLDHRELQEGDCIIPQIKSAIRTASAHVAIFSPRYAESRWCLDELVLMQESGAPIIPVFYNVSPSELRWTQGSNGSYAQALQTLEQKVTIDPETQEKRLRYDSCTIQKWRDALFAVSNVSGFELSAFNGDEGHMLDRLVETVLKRVKKLLHVAKYPTGLEEEVISFRNAVLWQRQPSRKPKVVGIVGLGGAGKTTLAKEYFNRESSWYSRSCFILDVRQNADKPSDLILLQKNILKSLIRFEPQIDNIDQGKEMLKKHLPSYPSLIILDNVDDGDQLDTLLPVEINDLSVDSLIVITTRNKDVLTNFGVEDSAIHQLTGLSERHSRELFCFHAFAQPYPPPEFESLVSELVKVCERLPLSLKVIGALLRRQNDRKYWQEQLDKLKQILPGEITKILKISYDALDAHEREMYLDIACLWVGEDKDTAIRIWNGSGWQGWLGLKNLENRCLVEIDTDNKIKMHDHLRAMGREIVEASGLRNRLWRGTENIDDLLQQLYNGQEIQEVRGIRMVRDDNKDDSSEMSYYQRWSHQLFWNPLMKFCNRLHNMRNYRAIVARELQFLDTEDGLLERILMRVHSPNLICLRWRKCCDYSLPYWIPMDKLRVLQVFGSRLNELWQGQSQAPLQLRELVIASPLSKLPKNIGQLKHLQVVVLGKTNLETLPAGFCCLQSLERFELTDCSKIKSLPDTFGVLTNLEHIDVSGCSNLTRLPDSFGDLIRLKSLNLGGCSNLVLYSETFGNIRGLEYIDLSHCGKIEVLPPQVERQPFLEKLLLEGTNIKEVPSAFEEQTDSEEIVLESHLLEMLPPSLGDPSNLKKVQFENCRELRCLPDSYRQLTELTKLTVYKCGLCELSFLQGVCPSLQHLRIVHCDDLEEVGALPNTIRRLEFINCSKLKKLEGLDGLSKLQMLNLNGSRVLEELPSIETLVFLKELLAVGCEKLKSIGRLAQLRNLRILNLAFCHELEEFPNVEHLESLEVLQAFECSKLKSIRGLMRLTKLRVIVVSCSSELEELPGVEHCMSLEKLDASQCPKLQWSEGVVVQLRQQVKELCM